MGLGFGIWYGDVMERLSAGCFATIANDVEYLILDGAHDGVGPQAGVEVDVGAQALVAGEVKEDPVRSWLEGILTIQDVEVLAADRDVLVERGGRNRGGVGVDGEGEILIGLPAVDGFGEEESAGEGGLAHTADAVV